MSRAILLATLAFILLLACAPVRKPGAAPSEAGSTARIESSAFNPLIGAYQLESGGYITISRSDINSQIFYYDPDDRPRVFLHPISGAEFLSSRNEHLTVIYDAPGNVTGLVFQDPEGRQETARRVKLYQMEEVRFGHNGVTLAGTLFTPLAYGPHPAVVFAHGSAPHERWHQVSMAQFFARHGIAVLIYDKRGRGESTGDFSTAGIEALAADALAGVGYLQTRAEIQPDRIGLWGTSQGAWVVSLAASQSDEVAFVIAASAAGMSIGEQVIWQTTNELHYLGYNAPMLELNRKGWLLLYDSLPLHRKGILPLPSFLWITRLDPHYSGLPAYQNIRQPLLIVQAGLDKQVPPRSSARLILEANPQADVIFYPTAKHSMWLAGENGYEHEAVSEVRILPGYWQALIDWIFAAVDSSPRPVSNSAASQQVQDDYRPAGIDSLAWTQRASLHLASILAFVLVFISSAFSWLKFGLARRPSGKIRNLAGLIGLINLIILAGFFVGLQDVLLHGDTGSPIPFLIFGYPPAWLAAMLLAYISILTTILLFIALVKAWQSRTKGLTRYILVIVTELAFIPFMVYWRLLG